MKAIIKICKKHGELTENEIRTYIRNRRGRRETTVGCKACHRETSARARNADRTKANEWNRLDRKKDPEKYKRYEENYINKHGIEKVRKYEVARIHGLTIEQYDAMIEAQNNICAICSKPETRLSRDGKTVTTLCVDHCHYCEEKGNHYIRGLLCHACNTAIGKFKDEIELLKKAIMYLEKHNHI